MKKNCAGKQILLYKVIYIYTECICINNQDELKFGFFYLLVYHTSIYLNQFDSYTCIIV